MITHHVPAVRVCLSSWDIIGAIDMTALPRPGQDIGPVNIVGGLIVVFRSAPRTDRGLPDGTCRTDVRFAGTRARA